MGVFGENDMKRIKATFMLLMCSAVLTGCGDEITNLPKKFEKNLDYTFGEYSVKDGEESNGYIAKWEVGFTDKNGGEQSAELVSHLYYDSEKKYFDSRSEEDKYYVYSFYSDAVKKIAERELWDNVISEYFELEYDFNLMKNDDITILLSVMPVNLFKTKNRGEFIDGIISPKNGIKLCEEDLSSLVAKEYVMTEICIWLNEGVEPEAYIEKVKSVIDGFEEYAPQNYVFIVKDWNNEMYFRKCKLFGEEIDESELVDDDGELTTVWKKFKSDLGFKNRE